MLCTRRIEGTPYTTAKTIYEGEKYTFRCGQWTANIVKLYRSCGLATVHYICNFSDYHIWKTYTSVVYLCDVLDDIIVPEEILKYERQYEQNIKEEVNKMHNQLYVINEDAKRYAINDTIATYNLMAGFINGMADRKCTVKKVVFNEPCTIVIWSDNTKTIVRSNNGDVFDPEKGLAMAIAKKFLGNKGNYYDLFKKWLPEEKEADLDPDLLKRLKRYAWETSKYGFQYYTARYYAGKKHKVVCAGDCYHVKNIKEENLLTYKNLGEAIQDGCRVCKHCKAQFKDKRLYILLDNLQCMNGTSMRSGRYPWGSAEKNILKHIPIEEDI